MVWFSPIKCHSCYTGFYVLYKCNYTHNLSPLSLQTRWKKSRALPSSSCWGVCTMDPVNPYSKNWPPTQPLNFFAVWIYTGFFICLCTCFQTLRHVWASYIYCYMLGRMSLTCLPILAQQWRGKHNDSEIKCKLWDKPHSCLFFKFYSVVCFM